MTTWESALAAQQEREDERRERAQELARLRDEEALAAMLVATASEVVFRNDRADGDPVVTFARLRECTAAYVAARDAADEYEQEHGL